MMDKVEILLTYSKHDKISALVFSVCDFAFKHKFIGRKHNSRSLKGLIPFKNMFYISNLTSFSCYNSVYLVYVIYLKFRCYLQFCVNLNHK